MIRFLLAAVIALFASNTMYTQNITVKGVVRDQEGKTLEMANVIAINNETQNLDAFGISNTEGKYKLSLKSGTTYTLKISFLGYKPIEETYTAPNADTEKDFIMELAADELDAVEVTYEMPVTVKGDTIVYDSDAFTNGTEKKLEDVLKKLPGVEVNDDGEIEVEGKKVTKVMVEGKDFFDGDSKLATKNIPSDAVDKIEVLRNHNEVSQLKGLTNDEDNVALNIKLKEGKKNFWFGDITVAAGLDERYLAHPKLFYYNPKYSINIITDLNNIGELPFTMRDYFNFTGGFRNLNSRGGTSFSVSSNGLGLSTLQNNRAKEIDTRFGAANFSYSPTKTWDLSGFLIYSYSDTQLEEARIRKFADPDNANNQFGEEETAYTNTSQNTNLGLAKLSSTYKPSSNLQFDYDALLKLSDQEEATNVVSISSVTDEIDENKSQKPLSINQNANLYYTLNDKNIFALEAQHLYQNEDPFYNAIRAEQPFVGIVPTDNSQSVYNMNQEKKVETSKLEAKVDYYWVPGPKSNLNFTLGTTQSKQQFNSHIFQVLDDDSTLGFNEEELNNNVDFTFSDVYLGFHYKVVSGKFTFNPGFTAHTYKSTNEQLGTTVSDELVNIVPDVYVNFQMKKSQSLRFNYAISRQFTDVNNFAQGYVFSNYNSMYSGNRNLESALYHTVSLNFFSFNMFNFTNIFANVSYSKQLDAFKNSSAITGINQVSSTINSNFADDNLTFNGRYQRTFWKLKVATGANLSYAKRNNIVNLERSVSESFTQSYNGSIATNFREAPNVELGYSYSLNDYDNAGSTTVNYTDKPFVKFDAAFLNGFIFTADYDYYHFRSKDATVDNEYDFLDAALSYQKPDSSWEYSVEVTNLLNTTSLNQDSFSDLYNTTSQYYIQPRYVMLKIKYNL
ncbi:carboxypeptidase-like regulatory domain-containing protein [Neptunitalea lumnitzerae]|uniref:TonB-dependent receptor n=1 Tax=Neptunitalea lumnitzerae TaxID=2965509 RepID=A0ABQ5MI18_9FLAO|nr:carboxypeptidase-like regulatory domain-containing protein [Neptunitalea sp. Y10]GLB49037.1 TonB-dependent receptor [Neptunitalea sp. Y10]